MSVRWHSLSEPRLRLAAMLAVLALAWPAAHAQNVNGSLAVSATILPPVAKQETRLTAFSMTRDGRAQLETTVLIAGPVSQIMMWSVSSSANAFVPIQQSPMLIEAVHAPESEAPTSSRRTRATRLRFGVDLGASKASPVDSSSRNVTVRIQCLIVPGT